MAQELKALATLPEEQGLIPNTKKQTKNKQTKNPPKTYNGFFTQ